MAFAAMPAMAGTSFPFICTGEGDAYVQLNLFAEGMDVEGAYTQGRGSASSWDGSTRQIIWVEQGEATIIVDAEEPWLFVMSFNSETLDAIFPFEWGSLVPGTCRPGAE